MTRPSQHTLLLSSLLLVACGETAAQLPRARPAAPVAQAAPQILGAVEGETIAYDDLDPEVLTELKKIENEGMQRKFQLLWAGVDEAVGRKLMEREAKHRGLSVDKLRQQEIVDKVPVPSEQEVHQFYQDNKSYIPVPFEQAETILKKQLLQQRQQDREQAFVDSMRPGADIRHNIPTPKLPRFDIESGDSPRRGEPDAKVTIIEFSDFQCPYCGRARKTLDALAGLYPKSVQVVFRDFPLRQHQFARHAAEAAQCAREQQKFWPYHDMLFDHASALTDDDLESYAKKLGLDDQAFGSCLKSDRPKLAVARNMKQGRLYGIDGTPAIFINGIKLIGLLPLPMMRAIIDQELSD